MQVVLFDNDVWRRQTYPLSLTRPVSNLRIGILTINEKWEKWLNAPVSFLTAEYLREKFPYKNTHAEMLLIRGNILPDLELVEHLVALKSGEALVGKEGFIAIKAPSTFIKGFIPNQLKEFKPIYYLSAISCIQYPEDIFLNNGEEIRKDFELVTKGRISKALSSSNTILGDQIFVEEGATAELSILNTLKGPIYLGTNSEIWEGCMIRGPFSLGEGSQMKMGTKVYSNVSIGPACRMGGELNTSVVWGNSSKGHDGYLGSSVLGEWCNWGAGSSNSNMKNNYKNIRLFDYSTDSYRETGRDFCGLIMADHSKCSINSSFNTGTVVGVSANIHGTGLIPKFVPDFSWGGAKGFIEYEIDKMEETANLVFHKRGRKFDEIEKKICRSVFEMTKDKRNF
jgi:UDP-N-acetylglucosamine diphosphorylase/glucosamine-1-phosphate N-acetyltransferase